jgi:hypothetical protein
MLFFLLLFLLKKTTPESDFGKNRLLYKMIAAFQKYVSYCSVLSAAAGAF